MGIILNNISDHLTSSIYRKQSGQTNIIDITYQIKQLKSKWAGHLTRSKTKMGELSKGYGKRGRWKGKMISRRWTVLDENSKI